MCEAVCLALEEQGRKTLHGHVTIWIKNFWALRKKMFFARLQEEKDKTKREVVTFCDRLVTTKLFDNDRAFDHECSIENCRQQSLPLVVGPQNLRNLRHINGHKHEEGVFAYCPHCSQKWTYEQLLTKCLMIQGQMVDKTHAPVQEEVPEDDKKGPPIPTARMQAKVLEHQKHPDGSLEECPNLIVNLMLHAMHTDPCTGRTLVLSARSCLDLRDKLTNTMKLVNGVCDYPIWQGFILKHVLFWRLMIGTTFSLWSTERTKNH